MYDYWDLQTQMHWSHNDIPLSTDVKDWNTISDSERKFINSSF